MKRNTLYFELGADGKVVESVAALSIYTLWFPKKRGR